MKTVETTVANFSGAYPDTLAINASGAGATDGTEYTAEYINNFVFGITQAFMSYADITPNGVTESASASQMVEAMQKGFTIGPGVRQMVDFNDSPGTLGYRAFQLNGQGIDRTAYPELDAVTYVGDADNAAVAAGGGAYFRSTIADGSNPDITGIYLILPETRGYSPRGLDVAASIDPDGASRFLGDNQGDTFQGWQGGFHRSADAVIADYYGISSNDGLSATPQATSAQAYSKFSRTAGQGASNGFYPLDDGTNGAPRTSTETRATNISTNFVVGY